MNQVVGPGRGSARGLKTNEIALHQFDKMLVKGLHAMVEAAVANVFFNRLNFCLIAYGFDNA